MRLSKKVALSLSILTAVALSACGTTKVQKQGFELKGEDRNRLTCEDYPSLNLALEALPEHVFLTTGEGTAVEVNGHSWVRFDVANKREGILILFGEVDGKKAWFSCRDNLSWTADVITDLENAD